MIRLDGYSVMVLRGGFMNPKARNDLYNGICDMFIEGETTSRIKTDHIDARLMNTGKSHTIGYFTGCEIKYEFDHDKGKGQGAVLIRLDPSCIN